MLATVSKILGQQDDFCVVNNPAKTFLLKSFRISCTLNMATLADQFLDDLDSGEDDDLISDLIDGHKEPDDDDNDDETGEQSHTNVIQNKRLNVSEDNIRMDVDQRDIHHDIQQILAQINSSNNKEQTPLDRQAQYSLVVRCMEATTRIEEEISMRFKKLQDMHAPQFPELQTLLFNALDYARVVKAIGDETDITKVDLSDILPSATVITVTVAASTTNGKPLSPERLHHILELCEEILQMDHDETFILRYVQDRINIMAPNLCILVGSSIAARLMVLAGGIEQLAQIPACNIQNLGSKKKNLTGFSTTANNTHQGIIFESDLVKEAPPHLRIKAARVVAAKTSLVARVDAASSSKNLMLDKQVNAPDTSVGIMFREQAEKKIEKWSEPPPAKTAKPLPVPDMQPKKRRGGKRYRKQKELYTMSELQKQQNRMAFGKQEETYYDNDEEVGFGMIGQEGSKKLRFQIKQTDSLAKAAKRKLEREQKRGGNGALEAGLTTSLVLTDAEGIKLGMKTPAPGGIGIGKKDMMDGIKSNYFDSATPFVGVNKKRRY